MAHIPQKPIVVDTRMDNYNKLINPTGLEGQSSFNVQTARQMWGNLWSLNPNNNTSPALDDMEYKQSLDLYSSYENRYLPIHSTMITAAIRNSRNDFLIDTIAPIFETNDLNFSHTRNEWNQIAFDDLQEGGIANEPTFTKWGWTDTTRKARQDVTISRDLALDPNYGEETFREHFAELSANTLLTLYKNVAYSLVTVGYNNMVQDRTVNLPFDLSRLYAAEARCLLAFAVDPDDAFNLIHEMEREIDGLDMVIIPENASRYMTEKGNLPRYLPARQLTYNDKTRSFVSPDDLPGPRTFRSYNFGDRWIDVMEMRSFTVNSLDRRAESPLTAKLTLCQFFPPNPDTKASDVIRHTSPELLDTWMFEQTKDKGENKRVAFKDSLKNCFYWDEKGEISNEVKGFIDTLNEKNRGSRHAIPWQFAGNNSSNINEDIGSYDNPSYLAMQQMNTSTDVLQMKSMRHKFCAAVWDSSRGEYHWPEYVGDNHLDVLPTEWVLKAVRTLAVKFEQTTGQNINDGLARLFSLLDNIKGAPVTDDYLRELINANMPEFVRSGPYNKNGINEFKVNAHGSLRLPTNESGTLSGMKYTNGFHSGPGLLTIRDQEHRPGTTFYDMAMEAKEALLFVDTLIGFIRNYIGQSEVIDPSLAAPWFQFDSNTKSKDAIIATFIDALYASQGGLEGPVFLGVPPSADYQRPDDSVNAAKVFPNTREITNFLVTGPLNVPLVINIGVGPVDDAIRALSRLGRETAQKYRTLILIAGRDVSDELFKTVIALTANNKSVDGRKTVNAIVEKFYALAAPDGANLGTDDNIKEAKAFIKRITSQGGLKKEAPELAKTDGFRDESDSFEASLTDYEQRFAAVAQTNAANDVTRDDRRAVVDNRGTARGGDRAVYFQGVYDDVPTTYMRSPLLSSPSLVDFIRYTGNRWALPADKDSLYTTPDLDADTRGDVNRPNSYGSSESLLHTLSGAHSLLNATLNTSLGADVEEDDYFAASRVSSKQRGLSSGSLFSFGSKESYGENRFTYTQERRSKPSAKDAKDPELILGAKYIGPWKAHLEFCKDQIGDSFHKIIYRALIQTRNTRDVHWRLADIGAQLINVIHFRPFVEFYANSAIVMRKGEETCATPVSRFDAYITKEHRGFFHIGCSFYYGFIRRRPENIRLIPYCFPDRFVSGKKVDFMHHRKQWLPRDPHKPSIIALPTPIAERRYRSPIHMMNRKTITRPDIDGPAWEQKYSSWEFYEHVFGIDTVSVVDELNMERFRYCDAVNASHVAYEGPRFYMDHTTLKLVEHDGTGPGNKWSMNTNGAQDVWNGVKTLFPDVIPSINTRSRGTV
jgi:hypothetical protein